MGATCSRCGDCCERIGFRGDWSYLQQMADWIKEWRVWAMENLRNGEDGGLDQETADHAANAEFLLAHWRPIPEDAGLAMPRFSCDAFDPVTRLCTAHAWRPPICRGYPWYGEQPGQSAHRIGPSCSFWADVPLDKRPGAGLRLLPVLGVV
jgi:Fe-S-cluster containining protein